MRKPMKKYFVLLLMMPLCACDPDRIYENNLSIAPEGWRRAEHTQFEVEIADTIQPYNVYINVRNNNHYKYMDLWLFVDVHSPAGGTLARDTVRILLADHHGRWLGHGVGRKFDTRIVFRKGVRFPISGTYRIEYEQAMREEPLQGIDDVGLRIEKHILK